MEPEARVVIRIFEDYRAGESQRTIVRALNAEGITTTRGRTWHQGTLAHLLRDPLYIGGIRFNGEVLDGAHDAIVPIELWEAVQDMLTRAARTRGHGGGRWPKGSHLFTKGLLRCGTCGSALIPVTKPTRTPGTLYEVYECYGRHLHGTASCDQAPVRRAAVDGAMFEELQRTYLDLDATRDRITARAATDLANARTVHEQAKRDQIEAADRLARVRRAFQDGQIDPEDWTEQRRELIAELDAATARTAATDRRVAELERPQPDPEAALLRQLGDVRTALVAGVGEAANLDGFAPVAP